MSFLKRIIIDGTIFIPSSWIRFTSYYLVPIILLLAVVFDIVEREALGKVAEILLLIILFSKPFSIIIRPFGIFRTIVGYRRQLGIATFYFALFHFLTYAFLLRRPPHEFLIELLQDVSSLWFGAIALIVLLVLYLTSNRIATRILKRWWKRLHRIVYLALPLVLIHASLVEGDGYAGPLLITGIFFVLKLVEWNWQRIHPRPQPQTVQIPSASTPANSQTKEQLG